MIFPGKKAMENLLFHCFFHERKNAGETGCGGRSGRKKKEEFFPFRRFHNSVLHVRIKEQKYRIIENCTQYFAFHERQISRTECFSGLQSIRS